MAWKSGYYYRQKWWAGTCVSEYVGNGLIAHLAADLDRIERDRQELERQEWQAGQEEQAGIDRQIDDIGRQVGAITEAVLLATGHHRHKGTWRKRRMGNELTQEEKRTTAELLARLQNGKGTRQDEKILEKMLKDVPAAWRLYGDLPQNALNHLIKTMTGGGKENFVLGASLETGIKQMRIEHGYNEASPLEKLLIEQLLLCWVRLYYLESITAQNTGKLTLQQAEHYEKRLSANQRRFLRACETLARVRRLASRTPEILQINVGQNQVNQVAGPV